MRNCLFCTEFYFTPGELDYSEYTPGSNVEIGCHKSKWWLCPMSDTEDDFRSKMLTSETCGEFKRR